MSSYKSNENIYQNKLTDNTHFSTYTINILLQKNVHGGTTYTARTDAVYISVPVLQLWELIKPTPFESIYKQ